MLKYEWKWHVEESVCKRKNCYNFLNSPFGIIQICLGSTPKSPVDGGVSVGAPNPRVTFIKPLYGTRFSRVTWK